MRTTASSKLWKRVKRLEELLYAALSGAGGSGGLLTVTTSRFAWDGASVTNPIIEDKTTARTTDAATPVTLFRFTPPNGSSIAFDATITCRDIANTRNAMKYKYDTLIETDGNVPSFPGGVNPLALDIQTIGVNFALIAPVGPTMSVVGGSDVQIQVRGVAGTTIDWALLDLRVTMLG